jgi:hypothetical protein
MKLKLLIASAVLLFSSAPSYASSGQAWAALDRQVTRACIAASGLTRAEVQADKASFPDRVPVEVRVVEGYNSGSVMDVKLCAYDRRTRRAAIVEGQGRLGVNRN